MSLQNVCKVARSHKRFSKATVAVYLPTASSDEQPSIHASQIVKQSEVFTDA